MSGSMWTSASKTDLIIEVWEKLDCESVGAAEIEAIMTVVEDRFGSQAVDSPMVIARHLSDEGAYLRHSEIMRLYLTWNESREASLPELPTNPELLTFAGAIQFIRKLEAERARTDPADKAGHREIRELALTARQELAKAIATKTGDLQATATEVDQWLMIWLQTPAIFESWLLGRRKSRDFVERFGSIAEEDMTENL